MGKCKSFNGIGSERVNDLVVIKVINVFSLHNYSIIWIIGNLKDFHLLVLCESFCTVGHDLNLGRPDFVPASSLALP